MYYGIDGVLGRINKKYQTNVYDEVDNEWAEFFSEVKQ